MKTQFFTLEEEKFLDSIGFGYSLETRTMYKYNNDFLFKITKHENYFKVIKGQKISNKYESIDEINGERFNIKNLSEIKSYLKEW